MKKEMSRSRRLIADMHRAALSALSAAPSGEMTREDLFRAIESTVTLDDWAQEIYETTGKTRWRSIFGFASVGLVKAQYVVKKDGVWSITEQGRKAIAGPFDAQRFLLEIDRLYRQWRGGQLASMATVQARSEDEEELLELPDERISKTLNTAHETLAAELVDAIKQCSPAFFERLVVQLLLKMGYGGSRQEAGKAVGRSGDGGIDGIINEDRLGLDAIYLQAKRWEGSVGEGPIRDFKGALDAKGAQKGVFITTSSFTPAAIEAARNSRSYRIVLIDGARLADLMIEHDLGVSVAATYQLKRIDSDFFADE